MKMFETSVIGSLPRPSWVLQEIKNNEKVKKKFKLLNRNKQEDHYKVPALSFAPRKKTRPPTLVSIFFLHFSSQPNEERSAKSTAGRQLKFSIQYTKLKGLK